MKSSPHEEGDPGSRIAFVGEAPSFQEIRQNRPFVGPAGMVFEECLHAAGIIRRQCYITNVFPYQVFKPKGQESTFRRKSDGQLVWTNKKGFSDLGMESVAALKKRLDRCKANVIVPLGNCALDALTDLSSIMKWRGSILSSNTLDYDRKLVPTIHPAAVLQGQYTFRYLIVHDLKRAREEAQSPSIRLPKRDLLIDPSFDQCLGFLKELEGKPRVATDVEIYNHQISCASFCADPSLVISIPLLDREGRQRWTIEEELEIVEAIARLLGDPTSVKVNHNILFDCFMYLYRYHIHVRGPIGDTMVAFNIIYPEFKKGLNTVSSIYTREPYYKDDGKIWAKPWRDMDAFWRYNAKDAAVAMESWILLEQEIRQGGYQATYDNSVGMFNTLLYMMIKGLELDKESLDATREKQNRLLEEARAELDRVADYPFNPISPKQCQDYFYIHKGARAYVSPRTGQVTTDDLALARLWRRHRWPEVRLAQTIRTLTKLIGTYYDVIPDPDGRLRWSYNPRGTWTGRLSSSQTIFGTGLNIQNLDPAFKEFLIPDRERRGYL